MIVLESKGNQSLCIVPLLCIDGMRSGIIYLFNNGTRFYYTHIHQQNNQPTTFYYLEKGPFVFAFNFLRKVEI